MKNFKTFIGKFIVTIAIVVVIITIFGGSTPSVNQNLLNENLKLKDEYSELKNEYSELKNENLNLKDEYSELVNKLENMEELTTEIKEYDNVIYSQILGVNFDTTDFNIYRSNKIDFYLQEHDSIFNEVDDRAWYAAEMLATQLTKLQETSHLFKNNKNAILYYPTIAPIKTFEFIYVSSPYGWRMHPILKKELFHEGIDISANVGSKVYSTAQGRVVSIMYSKYGYGNRILIKHAYGFETLYAHMGNIKVKKGQWVKKNQLIGTVGNTGRSTGPHLHYEIHKNGEPRDPLGYFYTHISDELLTMN